LASHLEAFVLEEVKALVAMKDSAVMKASEDSAAMKALVITVDLKDDLVAITVSKVEDLKASVDMKDLAAMASVEENSLKLELVVAAMKSSLKEMLESLVVAEVMNT